ncbi:MAG TPA: 2-C-methyl-D-erythritol 2,4-cyclodiphosphate synthase [Trueperaceae bacterium]|nr:2-C-methyl-D-erythritol 2,4-cyclodiphosphate synthase [Trueperaceae bacterium]
MNTAPEDAKRPARDTDRLRVGYGEDAHRLKAGRELIIGGVAVPESLVGAEAVSDGDVLLHALADALLSAFAQGDIGVLFPPDDPASRGLTSSVIVATALERIRQQAGAVEVINVSAVVTLDRPKLGPLRNQIVAQVGRLLGVGPDRVGLTFKTSEGLAQDYVQARVVVLVM